MTWEIIFVFVLLVLALASFVWEKLPPDVTALSLFSILIVSGILSTEKAFSVFFQSGSTHRWSDVHH